MKKCIPLIILIHFVECLFINSLLFLNAQVGWGPDVRLTYRPGYSYDPKATCCGDTIHLVWWEGYVDSGIHEEVFYKRSTDAGSTWGLDMGLSVEDAVSSTMPKISASNGIIHVVWFEQSYGLLYRRSFDGGQTWQDTDSIAPGMGYSSIRACGDTVYLAGVAGSTGDLRFARSTNAGNNWSPLINIARVSNSPTLKNIGALVLNLAVSYGGYPNDEVYVIRSFDGGQTWSDTQMVSENTIASQWPAMATDGSAGIHLSWFDYKYSPYPWTGDIFYRASKDSGCTWEPIDSLTVIHRAVASDILAEGNNLHLVWEDDRFDFNHNFEIMYRMSTNLGRNWQPEVRLTDTLNWSCGPSLACDGRYLHLFWFDLRDDTSNIIGEIYYKRKDLLVSISEHSRGVLASWLKLDAYPNPFSENLTVMMQFTPYETQDIAMMVYDIAGKEVVYRVPEKIRGRVEINTRNLPCGVYFVVVQAGEVNVMKKVVKVR